MSEILLITDRRLRPIEELWPVLPELASAGLTGLMIREKDLLGRPMLALARDAVARCRPLGIRIIVNDRVDVALAAKADAVHLGVAAMPVADARRIAGEALRIGASAHSIDELRTAAREGADYATFGPVFETPSKAAYGPPVGIAALREALQVVDIPVLALGGITPGRARLLAGTRIAGVAAISSILMASEPPLVVRAMAAALSSEGGAP